MNQTEPPDRQRAGNSQIAAATRRRLVVENYLRNGNNATQAAIDAGYAPRNAKVTAARIMQCPDVQAEIVNRAAEVAEKAEMTTEQWAQQIAAIMSSDLGEIFDEEMRVRPLHLIPAHARAAISSVQVTENGIKVTLWSKTEALNIAARHLGLFEKDTGQRGFDAMRVEVVLKG
jgi:hypothetical protein